MKVGIILEGKNPPDKRVAFTPEQSKKLVSDYPDLDLVAEESPIRAFSDASYEANAIRIVEELDDRDVIFGVKEVNVEDLLPGKIYFFFSHTIKMQPYNRGLLQAILKQKIQLVDYECLTDEKGRRLVGFGRYAGIVGCYNAFLAFGKRTNSYSLKPAHQCHDRKEMDGQLSKIELPTDYKIVLTGMGRVASGAIEVLRAMGIKQVTPADFLNEQFEEPVFCQLSVLEYFKRKDGSEFQRADAYARPEEFDSNFFPYACKANMYIPCHFWDSNGPVIFTEAELRDPNFKIRLIADISCDIAGPIPSTIRPSTIANPIYQYDLKSGTETKEINEDVITVMAVDNLPCELPKDASEDFGSELMQHVFPSLFNEDSDGIIERASITKGGKLMPNYAYLADYVQGKD